MSQPMTISAKCPACDKPLSRKFGTPEPGEWCGPCIDAVIDRFEHKNGKHLLPENSLAGPIMDLLYCRGMLRNGDSLPDEDEEAQDYDPFLRQAEAIAQALRAVGRPVVFLMQNQGFTTPVEELCSHLLAIAQLGADERLVLRVGEIGDAASLPGAVCAFDYRHDGLLLPARWRQLRTSTHIKTGLPR